MSEQDREAREQFLQIVMQRRGCDRDEAEVIMRRIADRLGGHTHEEVAEMHPLPEGSCDVS